ncbi:MAG: VOC family protein [Actinomycetota bacterium]
MLKRVNSTFYWTWNMSESLEFYRDVLGLDLKVHYGDDWAEFNVGDTVLAVHGARGGVSAAMGATVVFEVDDIEITMRALAGRGVEFLGGITDVPYLGRFASFRDPDGNVLQIFEPGPPHPVTNEGAS